MEPLVWLVVGLLGAWAALDGASAGQLMISRPLVTGTLTGLLLGDPESGFHVGLLLELAHLGSPPVGAARLPEPGPAGIGAAVVAAEMGGGGGIALGLALGLLLALVGGATVAGRRRWHGLLVEGLERGRLGPEVLVRRLWTALAVDALRGAALGLAGSGIGLLLVRAFTGRWPLGDGTTMALLLVLLALPAAGLVRALPTGGGRAKLLALGGTVGALLGVWMGTGW